MNAPRTRPILIPPGCLDAVRVPRRAVKVASNIIGPHKLFLMPNTPANSNSRPPTIWLLKDAEPLPIDEQPRLMRTGTLAEKLVEAGFSVVWWTSRFHHGLKQHRKHHNTLCQIGPTYGLYLLDGPGYRTNISLARLLHQRSCAAHFHRLATLLPSPDLVLASYPTSELCDTARAFAKERNIPFLIDVRDPWPDNLLGFFPPVVRWALLPVVWHYRRRLRFIANEASGVVSVSNVMLHWAMRIARRRRGVEDRVIPIGYDLAGKGRAVQVPERFSKDAPLVCLFFSSCGRSYDGSTLMNAARLLEERGERRIRFVVSGNGEMRRKWMRQATGLHSLQFTGWISHQEMERHLTSAHVGLVLLQGDITKFWLGNKFFEYLSGFLALINNVPGEAAEIIQENQMGWTIPPRDPVALAAALLRLVDTPDEVRRSMENSQKTFLEVFDRKILYDQYVEYIRERMNCRASEAGAAFL